MAKRLRTADAELAELESGADTPEPASTHLLEQALRLHTEHGDRDCPVCGTGRLDAAWAHAAQEAVRTDRQRSAQRKQATDDLELARIEAWGLLVRRPAALDEAPAELAEKVDSARTAWDAWTDRLRGRATVAALELADHLESRVEPLTAAIDDLREAAATELTAREDVWQPVRGRVLAWCEEWQAWLAAKPTVDRLGEAKKWPQDNDLQLRNDRLAPIRDGARQAWARLRQESNVEIGDLSLVGSATQRKLRIDSRIDGVEAGGLTVLSQGELHALALALFLPRATMAESPFRFLVLDDPVQAMDPAKVDGLVALLTELAQHRQVIVLSHDDRLPAAVRRGTFAATILEVNRGKDSQVSLSLLTDPAQRYLADAFALVKEHDKERVPAEALHRTLPGLLRFAVEAAARHTYFTRNLSCGRQLAELEREWEAADRTRRRVSLALFDDPSAEQRLENWSRAPYRKDALHTVGSKMHRGLGPGSDPQQAARAVERLIADLNAAAR
ncbi:ABC transporter ATP-binding protein [Nocardia flavorosea]|uniref:Nuclease SbcCD subunit C n=1 Tax=Nocardia flavorosea TaxID=53429 RepID=A0A846YJ67_9NOCA|nr:ABC transporter ATP-binding protein [Nocardia flavorosea]NKY59157.1 hypothetical protein [Nocardia flavorosea]